MKCTIPEISWHNKDPVLSVDIQPKSGEGFYRLASGGTDSHVLIWHLTDQVSGISSLECVSDLTRHQKAVNVVRFSPSGNFLASGDDESAIILWKQKTDQDPVEFPGEEEVKNQEQWLVVKILRGHLEDIYDLSWSADEQHIISGSVDNTAIIWDVKKGHMKAILRDHKSFVQGVAWDPAGQLLATLSSDRICRIFNATTQRIVSRIGKAIIPGSKTVTKQAHLFHDDTMKSFFRRLCFSPCGSLLIAPAGVIEPQEPGQKAINATLIFTRNLLSRPVAYLPSYNQYSVAVRCCPKLFTLQESEEPPLFNLPYRIVFAIATQSSVILYDTQHLCPFAYIANIHYTRLTDLAWSSDGKILIVSSTDGFCSVITFSDNELGKAYVPNELISDKTHLKDKDSELQLSGKSDSNTKQELNENQNLDNEKIENKTCDVEKSGRMDCKNGLVDDVKKIKENKELKKCSENSSKMNEPAVDNDDYCLILEESITHDMSISKKHGKAASTSKSPELELQEKYNEKKCDQNSDVSSAAVGSSNNNNVCFLKFTSNSEEIINNTVVNTEKNNQIKSSDIESEVCLEKIDTLQKKEKSDIEINIPLNSNEMNISSKTPSKCVTTACSVSSPVPTTAEILKNITPPHNVTPLEQRKPKRAKLITLSSPKSKKKL
ncbi:chromatin assembly factor 1, p105 subunit [Lycorma delicatula]|uniref:chromatin assembly factor 1, p105 subunit n=1 Tax=Lycorma delicatula TaxID=130591 RepID=UPI003F513FB6